MTLPGFRTGPSDSPVDGALNPPGPGIEVADVPGAFSEAASRYDLMVALNPGYHRHLRRQRGALLERPRPDRRVCALVDLGCGSGASTRALLGDGLTRRRGPRRGDRGRRVGRDARAGGTARVWPDCVRFDQGRAEALPRQVWPRAGPAAGRRVRRVPVPQRASTRRRGACGRRARPAAGRAGRSSSRSTRSPGRGGRAWSGRWCPGPWSSRWLADLAADPAVPLPLAQRAGVRPGRAVHATGSARRGSSTSRSARSAAGSTASCTRSAPASRRPA